MPEDKNGQPGNRICVILPYIGPFPTTWPLTLRSMASNDRIDWHIYTDQNMDHAQLAPNILVESTSLAELRSRFSKTLGFPVSLESPYKLCDFKPAYGELFHPDLSSYDFWGYADADVVFGDVMRNVETAIKNNPTKIFQRGHLSLLRNGPEGTSIFRRDVDGVPSFRQVFTDTKNYAYDEGGGTYRKVQVLEIPFFEDNQLFDIDPARYVPAPTKASRKSAEERYFVYTEGRTISLDRQGNEVREGRYIHLQKRPFDPLPRNWEAARFIGFAPGSIVTGQTPEDVIMAIRKHSWQPRVLYRWYSRPLKARFRNMATRWAKV